MKKNGFTLIELLAVIVILAVIALIAVPVILNVIDSAKKGSAEVSALVYVDAVEDQVIKNQVTNENLIQDGAYDVPMNGVSVKGTSPTSGWVVIEKGQVINYSLLVDSYLITKGEATVKGDTTPTKPIVGTNEVYDEGDLVFFDPVSETECNENTGSSTCYKWRVIETEDTASNTSIKLQMDHNLINKIEWYESSQTNTLGPKTALTALNSATTTWNRVDNLTYEYDTSVNGTSTGRHYGKMTCNNGVCTLNGTRVEGIAKARMITGEEVTAIANTKVTDETALSKTWKVTSPHTDYFYFSNTGYKLGTKTSGTGNTDLKWLVENTSTYGNSGATANEYGAANAGYWTLSPVFSNSNYAWNVYYYGYLYDFYVDYGSYGVRPVITVLKSKIYKW